MSRIEEIKKHFEHGDTPTVGEMEYLLRIAETAENIITFVDLHNEHPDKYSHNWTIYFMENIPIEELKKALEGGRQR